MSVILDVGRHIPNFCKYILCLRSFLICRHGKKHEYCVWNWVRILFSGTPTVVRANFWFSWPSTPLSTAATVHPSSAYKIMLIFDIFFFGRAINLVRYLPLQKRFPSVFINRRVLVNGTIMSCRRDPYLHGGHASYHGGVFQVTY